MSDDSLLWCLIPAFVVVVNIVCDVPLRIHGLRCQVDVARYAAGVWRDLWAKHTGQTPSKFPWELDEE